MISIDRGSPIPPFEQVRAQIAAQIADGALSAGARLPTVGRLAADLDVAVNTIARTYRELEAAGLVETHGRGGTIVTARGDQALEQLVSAAGQYAALARDLGIGAAEALRVAGAALDPANNSS